MMKKMLAIGVLALAFVALAAGAIVWSGADAETVPERAPMGRMPLGRESSLCDPSIPPCGWPPSGESKP